MTSVVVVFVASQWLPTVELERESINVSTVFGKDEKVDADTNHLSNVNVVAHKVVDGGWRRVVAPDVHNAH